MSQQKRLVKLQQTIRDFDVQIEYLNASQLINAQKQLEHLEAELKELETAVDSDIKTEDLANTRKQLDVIKQNFYELLQNAIEMRYNALEKQLTEFIKSKIKIKTTLALWDQENKINDWKIKFEKITPYLDGQQIETISNLFTAADIKLKELPSQIKLYEQKKQAKKYQTKFNQFKLKLDSIMLGLEHATFEDLKNRLEKITTLQTDFNSLASEYKIFSAQDKKLIDQINIIEPQITQVKNSLETSILEEMSTIASLIQNIIFYANWEETDVSSCGRRRLSTNSGRESISKVSPAMQTMWEQAGELNKKISSYQQHKLVDLITAMHEILLYAHSAFITETASSPQKSKQRKSSLASDFHAILTKSTSMLEQREQLENLAETHKIPTVTCSAG